jgi:hypothetical protein
MAARRQGTLICFSKKKQTNIGTASLVTEMWRFNKLNSGGADITPGTEDDSAEYGKGHEFATQIFLTQYDAVVPLEKYGSSQFLAWAFAFALGKVVMSGSSPYVYAVTPMVPATDGLELPYLSYVEQTPGTDEDRLLVGCQIEEVQVFINSGPGRQNCRVQVTLAHSGILTLPSAITIPAATTENLLPAGTAAITINGTDYVANKNIVSVQFGWKNNIQLSDGFFPGSGFQTAGDATSGAVRGRMEYGARAANFSFVARANSSSPEYAALIALTSGTAVVNLSQGSSHIFQATFQKMPYRAVRRGDLNGLCTVEVTGDPMYHPSNGILSVSATTTAQNICQ